MAQIEKAWSKSKTRGQASSPHKEFPDEMCKRTVINRACKRYINSSSDSAILKDAMERADEIATDEEVAEEIEESANREMIDIEGKGAEGDGEAENGEIVEEDEGEQGEEPKEKKKERLPGF
jgi:recombination protein RecT